jgi:hypothetical protein
MHPLPLYCGPADWLRATRLLAAASALGSVSTASSPTAIRGARSGGPPYGQLGIGSRRRGSRSESGRRTGSWPPTWLGGCRSLSGNCRSLRGTSARYAVAALPAILAFSGLCRAESSTTPARSHRNGDLVRWSRSSPAAISSTPLSWGSDEEPSDRAVALLGASSAGDRWGAAGAGSVGDRGAVLASARSSRSRGADSRREDAMRSTSLRPCRC